MALPSLRVELQPHQQVGIRRLQQLWCNGSPGGLLCDDMGLGKTLQALVFASWAAEQLGDASRSERDREDGPVDVPIAIVAPPSLLDGWLAEMDRRLLPSAFSRVLWGQTQPPSHAAGSREVLMLNRFLVNAGGQGTVLEHARVNMEALRAARPSVLLIGYDTLRRLQFAVGQIRFGVIIADEVQETKDPNSLRSRALRAMRYDFGLALTGTPIENTWRDLWTICDFAVPGRLGTLQDFDRTFPSKGDTRDVGQRLGDTLQPVMIRRTRAVALSGLPPCTVVAAPRDMPSDQRLAYQAEVGAYERSATGILGLLQQLARVSLHPRIRADLGSTQEADRWAAESARTTALWEALRRYQREGAGVLVFVRSLAMQETLQRALLLSFQLDHVGILNGKVQMRQRHELVDMVRRDSGFRVLIVSPDVGGAGWNMQFASRAVLLERPYNPAVEAQMIARVHRLGQPSAVEIVTPLATSPGLRTFDEILDGLLTEKRTLSESVLAPVTVSDEEVARRFGSLVPTAAAATAS